MTSRDVVQVYTFEEAEGKTVFELGGKGYGLVEMSKIGLPVPPGLIIPTSVCKEFYKMGQLPPNLIDEVLLKLKKIEEKVNKRFGSPTDPLLLSVRSGAPYSMPGMMDTILNLGLNDVNVRALSEKTENKNFAYDLYFRLIEMFGTTVMGVDKNSFNVIRSEYQLSSGISEVPIENYLQAISKAKNLIKDKSGFEFPQDPKEQLQMAITMVFKSWNNPRAKLYRKMYKIPDDACTAVVLQVMVFGNMGLHSGSGVCFTRNPSTGGDELYGEYLKGAQGEAIVAGAQVPQPLDALKSELPQVYDELRKYAKIVERHFKDMQEIEFTVQEGRLYILQTRMGKRTPFAALKIAVDLVKEGVITKQEAITRVDLNELNKNLLKVINPTFKGKPILKGLGASPGVASGKVVFKIDDAVNYSSRGESIILVRPETSPEDLRGVSVSQGVLTAKGGITSHAAVVMRGLGKPAVVGAQKMKIDLENEYFSCNGIVVRKFDYITIDGNDGCVYLGVVPTIEQKESQEYKEFLEWLRDYKVSNSK